MPVNIRELVVSTSVQKAPAIQRVKNEKGVQSETGAGKEEAEKVKDSPSKDVCASGDGSASGGQEEIVEEVLRQVMELLTEIGER